MNTLCCRQLKAHRQTCAVREDPWRREERDSKRSRKIHKSQWLREEGRRREGSLWDAQGGRLCPRLWSSRQSRDHKQDRVCLQLLIEFFSKISASEAASSRLTINNYLEITLYHIKVLKLCLICVFSNPPLPTPTGSDPISECLPRLHQ